jgi:CNT family concentrative nucleoside transporter
LGLVALIVLAWIVSEDRRRFCWRVAIVGVLLQLLIGLVLIRNPAATMAFAFLNNLVIALGSATAAGTSFAFGYLGTGSPPFAAANPGNYFILAFQALPLILVVSAISALLFHWRILPLVVRGFSWTLRQTLGISGCEGIVAAANVFVGMIEAPLFIRPYLQRLTRSELFCCMVCGMATVAGTVMVLYANFLAPVLGAAAMGHLLAASILSAPAAIVIAKIMVPPAPGEVVDAVDHVAIRSEASGSLDAIVRGTMDGVTIAINVTAMLIVSIAFIYLVDKVLCIFPTVSGEPLALQRILGWGMAPVMWLIGIPWSEAAAAGGLMGLKTVANELLAYLALPSKDLTARSALIMTYALCGFANFASLGIMIGGMGAITPERRREIVDLGLKSIVAGTLATLMTGAIVGMLTAG